MGIPYYFYNLTKKYKNILIDKIPIDISMLLILMVLFILKHIKKLTKNNYLLIFGIKLIHIMIYINLKKCLFVLMV